MIYPLIAFGIRSFFKNKFYSALNVMGLMLGFLSFIFIMFYVNDERAFDTFHQKGKNIYRLTSASKERHGAITPYVWARYMQNDLPEVENYVVVQKLSLTTKKEELVYAEEGILAVDSTFFEVFDFSVQSGDSQDLLRDPNKLLITREASLKYFGSDQPVGKTLKINLFGTFVSYEVQGVVECPKNSHLQFSMLVPFQNVKKHATYAHAYEHWRIHFVYTYLLMSPGFDKAAVEKKMGDFLLHHAGEEVQQAYQPRLEALEDIYLRSNLDFDFQPRGNLASVRILALVAIGILFMAIINFVNIMSARSLRRFKEVGIRKILGSGKRLLVLQFMTESFMASLMAGVLALVGVALLLSFFNDFSGKAFEMAEVFQFKNIVLALMVVLGVGILSGIYPALALASFRPIHLIGGVSSGKSKSIWSRKVLVTLQFSLSAVLLIATGVIYRQVEYMHHKDVGFDQDRVIVINDSGQISSSATRTQRLREELMANNSVLAVSASSNYPGQQSWAMRYFPEGHRPEDSHSLSTIFVDHDFLQTYGIEIVQGRGFDRSVHSDSGAYLINESAASFFAGLDSTWADSPLHKRLNWYSFDKKGEVIGVFKDFNFSSLRNNIDPLIIHIYPKNFFAVQLKLANSDLKESLAFVAKTWKRLFPEVPFNYKFVEEEFSKYLETDRKLGQLLQLFAFLSIVVGMLGLFGLASFLVFEMAREISIRKVLGASEKQIVWLLVWLFLKLVLIANLLAIPLGYYLMDEWLQGFAYRLPIPIYIFAWASALTVVVSVGTVLYHAIRTASINPVKILSTE